MDLLDRNKRGHCCQNNLCNPIHRSIHRSFSHWRRNTHPQNHNNKIMMPLSLSPSLSSSFAMLVALFWFAFAFVFVFACSLTPKTKQSNKNNNNPKTKATATDQRNKILYNKSFAAAAAAVTVLFPFAKNSLLCNPPILSFATKKNPPEANKQNLLIYFCSNNSLPTYLNDNKGKMKKWGRWKKYKKYKK